MTYVCREVVAMMTEYLEDRLSPDERSGLEVHLATCPACVEYLRQLRLVVDTLGEVPDAPVPPEIEDQMVAIFRAWKQRQT